MLIIPAVDIRQGNCVMLQQGKIADETIYSKDPVFMAKLWKAKGAERLHVVDLDGSFSGNQSNNAIIGNICLSVDMPVQIGGGIRSMKRIDEIFTLGASYAILGTVAIYNPDVVRQAIDKYGSERIIVAVDIFEDKVAIGGWKEITPVTTLEMIDKLKNMGVKEIIYTDISKDGMLKGPNIDGLKKIAKASKMNVIASGGVTTIDDVKKIAKLEKIGVIGAIVGKALYTEDFKLEEAIRALNKK
ncbi:MAG: 1-(5-phosphoribosyl)-5-[(5-phosphoribosylamino)methylideneamino]imidazole-4-carboxamide isomerase [Endomicrobiia bacterium]|nr:1-(5-phosphoribosyl)-5-[(5-phosphoribosylamino)methylideneamino]imidazole-4-carboxamide isomerase [Endomicrobiaceae bacterium]MDD5102307.1 1-(5-phosphoribosyl)-5-[(5-phosphoribosylamino)methylideneamino]imidazole-4-carboxamide isomerase [Endomicrobiaceae bacterium]